MPEVAPLSRLTKCVTAKINDELINEVADIFSDEEW